jgi:hypothetical protein
MRWLRLLFFAWLSATVSATTHRSIFADLTDRARSLPPEFAADALLRTAGSSTVTDVKWKREILEDAFNLAASAQEPFARRNWTGSPGSVFRQNLRAGPGCVHTAMPGQCMRCSP